MKKFIFLLLLLACRLTYGQSITAKIWVTNAPANNDTIVINGATRTWKTSASSVSEITLNPAGSNQENATNYWLNIIGNPYVGPLYVSQTTNMVQLIGANGQALAVTVGSSWGKYTSTTNAATVGNPLRVPFSVETATNATNYASQVLVGMNTFATNFLNVAQGGTGAQSLTASRLLLGSGTSAITIVASLGTTNQFLQGNADGAPTFGSVDLARHLTGVLPLANGGNGVSTVAFLTNFVYYSSPVAPTSTAALPSGGNKFIAFDGTNFIYFGSANIDGPTTNWIRMPYTHY